MSKIYSRKRFILKPNNKSQGKGGRIPKRLPIRFSKKTLNIEKDTEIVIPEDIDMTDYKQYSYDELVKGFAELGKKLDNSSRSQTDC